MDEGQNRLVLVSLDDIGLSEIGPHEARIGDQAVFFEAGRGAKLFERRVFLRLVPIEGDRKRLSDGTPVGVEIEDDFGTAIKR
ncbi:MAG TPA: hypothetical protein VNI60_02635 [Pyrinomonadaceae bacterium]|nr:hypothetical protein [Pyrinomonadaceae bacterium]